MKYIVAFMVLSSFVLQASEKSKNVLAPGDVLRTVLQSEINSSILTVSIIKAGIEYAFSEYATKKNGQWEREQKFDPKLSSHDKLYFCFAQISFNSWNKKRDKENVECTYTVT